MGIQIIYLMQYKKFLKISGQYPKCFCAFKRSSETFYAEFQTRKLLKLIQKISLSNSNESMRWAHGIKYIDVGQRRSFLYWGVGKVSAVMRNEIHML